MGSHVALLLGRQEDIFNSRLHLLLQLPCWVFHMEKNICMGYSEERSWPEANLLALFRWFLRHRRKLTGFLLKISWHIITSWEEGNLFQFRQLLPLRTPVKSAAFISEVKSNDANGEWKQKALFQGHAMVQVEWPGM